MTPRKLYRVCFSKTGAHIFAFAVAFAASLAVSVLQAATPPTGFSDSAYVTGLSSPTAMAFAPDGRLFVAEQGGNLRVIEDGTLLSTPFVSLSVDSTNERGLLGVAFDPNFTTNNFVYVYYTTTASDDHNRVSRFTANGNVAVAGSETIIVELDAHGASNHNGGAIHFGPDGKLYIATGDNANGANAQMLNNRHGKILRLNADGSIPSDNPFFGTASGANRAIWALGLRNPFTFTFQPGTGRMFINDVGQNTWEEINDGIAGSNYGWPATEGETTNPAYRSPLFAYDHGEGCAITGGAFYNPSTPQFPAEYTGDYFFADYCSDWIRRYDPGTDSVTDFLTGASGPVDIQVGADGSLYYLNINNGSVRRVQFSAGAAPSITDHPDSALRAAGQSVTFTVSASGTPPLSYQWQRNNVNISGATSSSYTIGSVQTGDNGANFRAVVTNSFGSATSNNATLTVTSSSPPTASITTPAAGTLYNAGTTINYSGNGTDPEDGTLPASAFTWSIVFHHADHTHPFIAEVTGAKSGSFQIPDIGHIETNVWYRIHLTVEDSTGLTHTVTRDINPRIVDLTLDTEPSGLQVTVDGQPRTAPHTVESVIGMRRAIGAVSPQLVSGDGYIFDSWAHGGAATHEIVTPGSDTSYEARFLDAILFDDKSGQNQPLNGEYPAGVANWGSGQWLHSAPFGLLTTKNLSFANSGMNSASFSFVTPRRLVSLQAYNGGSGASTVTLSCAGQTNKQQSVPAGQLATITTGWTGNCSSVTIASSNGWNTNFDNLAFDGATATYGVDWTADNTPSSMATGATVDVNLSFTNTGSATWNAAGANPVRVAYHWRQGSCPGASTAVWDGIRTNLTSNVSSGGSVTNLSSDLRAPSSPGTYCLIWDLVKEGTTWFSTQGAATLNKTVSVTGLAPFDVTWTDTAMPSLLPANGLVNVKRSFTNSGASTWNSSGANPVRLSYHWRQGACNGTTTVVWDGLRTGLPGNVAPDGDVTNLTGRVRTPSSNGTYCLVWDLVKEGVTWFSSQGADTLNRTVVVGTYDVNWTADNIPASIDAGDTVNVTLSFNNGGSVTWPSSGANPIRVSYHWRQGACPSSTTVVWDGLRTGLPSNVAPSANVSNLNSQLRAPSTPGTYCVVWDLVHEGVSWFSSQGANTLQQTVTVE